MSLQNVWHHRKVADGAAKACWICYKPTPSVLITPSNKDFFYICVGHLSDPGFCHPDANEASAIAARRKGELEREIDKVKKKYEGKQKLKEEKNKGNETGQNSDKKKDQDAKTVKEGVESDDTQTKDNKIKELSKPQTSTDVDLGPRIFTLHKNFYQMRIDKIRNAEIAKKNRERLSNPAAFPSPPTHNP